MKIGRPERRAKGTLFDTFPPPSFESHISLCGWHKTRFRSSFMLIGYARVSTDDQNLDLQVDALRRAGCEHIYCDHGYSGMLISRPALEDALHCLNSGDTLVIWRLDRLGRSLSHLISLVGELQRRGIELNSLADAINTSTAGGRLQFHLIGALAEFERCLISERTKAGMAAARDRGVNLGRRRKLDDGKIEMAKMRIGIVPLTEMARNLEVSLSTLRRALSGHTKAIR